MLVDRGTLVSSCVMPKTLTRGDRFSTDACRARRRRVTEIGRDRSRRSDGTDASTRSRTGRRPTANWQPKAPPTQQWRSASRTARSRRSGPADRSHICRNQAPQVRVAELRFAFARRRPPRQKTPFCPPPTDRTEGSVSVQIFSKADLVSASSLMADHEARPRSRAAAVDRRAPIPAPIPDHRPGSGLVVMRHSAGTGLPLLLGGADQHLIDCHVPRPGNDVGDVRALPAHSRSRCTCTSRSSRSAATCAPRRSSATWRG